MYNIYQCDLKVYVQVSLDIPFLRQLNSLMRNFGIFNGTISKCNDDNGDDGLEGSARENR